MNNSTINNHDRHTEHASQIRRRPRTSAIETKKKSYENERSKAQERSVLKIRRN